MSTIDLREVEAVGGVGGVGGFGGGVAKVRRRGVAVYVVPVRGLRRGTGIERRGRGITLLALIV